MISKATIAAFCKEAGRIRRGTDEEELRARESVGGLGGALAGEAVNFAGHAGASQIPEASRFLDQGSMGISPEQLESLKKHMGVAEGVEFVPTKNQSDAAFGSGRFTDGKTRIWAPMDHGPTVAHEMGHANSYLHSPALRATQTTRILGNIAHSATGMGVGRVTGALAPSDNKTMDYVAPAITAAGHVPVLVDEAAASMKALKGLKHVGFNKRQLAHSAGDLGLAFGSYAAGATADTLGTVATRKVKKLISSRLGSTEMK